ncbi:MAG TPA: hypothetical protein VKP30_21845, partial [Polyangiaceae bacterium]|nr:hypothetical protein [Polyangiaceae bacterium]
WIILCVCASACNQEPAVDSANAEEVVVAQEELSGTRHEQTTRAGVAAWVIPSVADQLVNVSTIGDRDSVAKIKSQTHFDNCYWNESKDWILQNRNLAVQAALQWYDTGDEAQLDDMFDALGFALHAVEDFYSHSNWVETNVEGALAPLHDPAASAPTGWYSGTYSNPGDSGPNPGALHCPPGTPSHLLLNKDLPGGDASNEAFLDATLAATDLLKRFISDLNAALGEPAAADLLSALGFVSPLPATTDSREDFRLSVSVPGGPWGLAGPAVYCRPGTYVAAFLQRVESSQGSAVDDTALNSLIFYCKDLAGNWSEPLNVWQGSWGDFSPWEYCPTSAGFITGAELKVESQQGAGDDTSANAARFWCNDGAALGADNDGPWGDWRGRAVCEQDQAVCGVQLQYEPPQGLGDDTAMNGLRLQCCAI